MPASLCSFKGVFMFKMYIGLRGSGKSSLACKYARKWLKKGFNVYSNFPIKGCYLYDSTDIGKYDISNCCFILDEAGIDISNRDVFDKTKAMSKEARRWWKLSRHYGVNEIVVFSQALDFDITLRRLADKTYILTKGLLPHFSRIYFLHDHWDIDSEGQPVIKYKIPVLFLPFYRRPYYSMFDSYSAPVLDIKYYEYIPPDIVVDTMDMDMAMFQFYNNYYFV